ncbi:MAG TPA: VOC family protein [Actinoplanes sp.]|nr:VOC family protein [Actinoplanes sp.]
MANEVTVPLLPCRDIDEIAGFYAILGFRTTYRQEQPHPYVALRRQDLHLHFFVAPGAEPGSCLVLVRDVGTLHRGFADALRAAYGTVPASGTPRLTRPRVRRTTGRLTGFSVVDPDGNTIRVMPDPGLPDPPAGPLRRALENAVVLAGVRGDPAGAAAALDHALAEAGPPDHPVTMAEALAYRAELALVLDDPATATAALERARELDSTGEELAELSEVLAARAARGTVPR